MQERSSGTARLGIPPAPDGGDRHVGEVRIPDLPAVRGPAAGVPDLSAVGILQHLVDAAGADADGHVARPSDTAHFQHASERRFAALLDFYGVAWDYEPDEFPIEWDDEGAPTAWFRPDFHLPGFDLYVEITTSQQRLVTKKNRKLRLLREHHPQVRCLLFYQRDYLELVRKYGLGDLAEGEQE